MNSGISSIQQAVDRLIADPDYRIQVVVENNYPEALRLYQEKRMETDAPGVGTLALRLMLLRGSGHAESVNEIINAVPWVFGKNDISDGAFRELKAMVDANQNDIELDAGQQPKVWSMAIGSLAQLASTIAGGQIQRDADERTALLLHQQAYLQQQQERDSRAAYKRNVRILGIAAGVVVAIVVVIILIKRK